MYAVSLDIPSVLRQVEREDDTINDPLAILIAAEEELEFDGDADTPPNCQHNDVEKSS